MAGMRSRWRMRCRACRRRGHHGNFTLRRNPKFMNSAPKCPVCKSQDVADMEAAHRNRQRYKEAPCKCFHVPHPHQRGTHRMCEAHPLADTPLTQEEEYLWLGVLNNKRRTTFQ